MSKLHYLATPIKHKEPSVVALRYNYNLMAVNTLMREMNYLVYAPMLHYFNAKRIFNWPTDWEFWKTPSLEMVKRCDGGVIILQIDGWLDSQGVGAEIAYAKELGLPIMAMPNPEEARIEPYTMAEVVERAKET